MQVRVLFYKAKFEYKRVFRELLSGKWPKVHLTDDGISLWTAIWNWGTKAYSHCELLIVADEKAKELVGKCFTSTMRGEHKGTVLRPLSEVVKHPERWDCTEPVEINFPQCVKLRAYIQNEVLRNAGYDVWCIVSFFLPWRFYDYAKNICVEAVQTALYYGGIFKEIWVWSPRRLSRKLIKKGIKIGPLKEMLRWKVR